jgi:hypothetical protein
MTANQPGPTRPYHEYIGGSKIASIMGVNPWADRVDVYEQIVEKREFFQTAKMEIGNIVEREVLEAISKDSGLTFEYPGTLTHPRIDFIAATPDAVEYTATTQMKTLNPVNYLSDAWGPDGSGYVPEHTFYQANWEAGVFMDVYDRMPSFSRVVPYCGTSWRMHICEFDLDLYELCKAEAVKFWTDHIVPKVKPERQVREAEPEWFDEPAYSPLVQRYLELRDEEKGIHEEKRDVAAALRRAADKSNLKTDAGTVRVLEAKGRINWKALAHDLQTAGVLSKNMMETYRGEPGHRIEVRENKE